MEEWPGRQAPLVSGRTIGDGILRPACARAAKPLTTGAAARPMPRQVAVAPRPSDSGGSSIKLEWWSVDGNCRVCRAGPRAATHALAGRDRRSGGRPQALAALVHARLARYPAALPAFGRWTVLVDAEHGRDGRRARLSLCRAAWTKDRRLLAVCGNGHDRL